MHILADAFIPLSPVAPAAQALLLFVIIIVEGLFVRKRLTESSQQDGYFLKIIGINFATAALGVLLAVPVMFLESALAFGWGSDAAHPLRWYAACALYGIGLPWSLWIICYHVSWRTEYWLFRMTKGIATSDTKGAKTAFRDAHRLTYAILALPVLALTLWYWISIFHPLE